MEIVKLDISVQHGETTRTDDGRCDGPLVSMVMGVVLAVSSGCVRLHDSVPPPRGGPFIPTLS